MAANDIQIHVQVDGGTAAYPLTAGEDFEPGEVLTVQAAGTISEADDNPAVVTGISVGSSQGVDGTIDTGSMVTQGCNAGGGTCDVGVTDLCVGGDRAGLACGEFDDNSFNRQDPINVDLMVMNLVNAQTENVICFDEVGCLTDAVMTDICALAGVTCDNN